MKKRYIHFLAPLLGLIVFIAFYWNFNSKYEAKLDEKARIAKEQKIEKLREEERNRKKAVDDAIAAQERRKVEKAAKEAKQKADEEHRQALIEAKRKADRDLFKAGEQVRRLQGDVKTEQEAIAALEKARKSAIEEEAFLKVYVRQAETNTKSLQEVLDKIAAADAARAQAEALAAAKARNS